MSIAIEIEDAGDPRLADYALLTEPRSLARRGLFVAEGRFVVERLLAERRYVVESLLLNKAAHRALAPLLAQRQAPVFVCPQAVTAALTGHDFHRGCLALVQRPPARGAEELLASARLAVVLEGVANPDNVGGVFRNAAAFGADAVLLGPACADPLYRKAIRTSMGATLRVPHAELGSASHPWPQCLAAARELGFELLALTPRKPALDIDEYIAGPRVALLLGAEGQGLSAGVLDYVDRRLRIPIGPDVDSLNVAVASGIALHRLAASARPS